jgi:hypothetical protein
VTTTSDGTNNHRVGVQLNGIDVGEMTFAGQTHFEQAFPVSLVDGENIVTLLARGGDVTIDTTLVDAIKLGTRTPTRPMPIGCGLRRPGSSRSRLAALPARRFASSTSPTGTRWSSCRRRWRQSTACRR